MTRKSNKIEAADKNKRRIRGACTLIGISIVFKSGDGGGTIYHSPVAGPILNPPSSAIHIII